ncbi:hypothetical protein GJAV_G00128450 [Gymnothorax javanicus]|nr:hypothetical protein GJAV_G00128450 [Gymnothorax javanicus]
MVERAGQFLYKRGFLKGQLRSYSYRIAQLAVFVLSDILIQPDNLYSQKAMKMHSFIIFCLLGVLSAQEVTISDLRSCQIKNNLRMDCRYTLKGASKELTCTYKDQDKVMGSTNTTISPEAAFKGRANVAFSGDKLCRLTLTGFSKDNPKNISCTIEAVETATKTVLVDYTKLEKCSAISMLLQSCSKVLLALAQKSLYLNGNLGWFLVA